MGRQAEPGARVLGPYKHGRGWRCVVVREGGKDFSEVVETEEDAGRLKRILERQLEKENVERLSAALETYKAYMVQKGNKPSSVTSATDWLTAILVDLDVPATITPAQAKKLYEDMRERPTRLGRPYSVAGLRNALNAAKTFGRWQVKRGAWRGNPFEKLEVLGKINKGKDQLRIDEARRWLAVAEPAAAEGDVGAMAALCCFLLGMRASEVVDRVVRDLDDGGRVLWIDRGKTDNAKRRLTVPERLRPHLLRQAEGEQPIDRLLPGVDRYAVRRHVHRLCRLAGVPLVCAHSMRGLLATLAVEGGAVLAQVADGLGHSSPAVTLMHYAKPGSAQAGATKRGMEVMDRPLDFVAKSLPEPDPDKTGSGS